MARPPAHVVLFGPIKVTIWRNQNGQTGQHFTAAPVRLYKNGDKWVESQRFYRDDLLLLAKAADVAHTWICEQSRRKESSAD